MSRTFRSGWGPEFKTREARQEDVNHWKIQVQKELEDMTNEETYVYVIINEWTPAGSVNSSQEIVGARFFDFEADAWDHLSSVADAFGIDLDPERAHFDLPATTGIDEQSYYIEELVNRD